MSGWTALIPIKPWALSKSRLGLSDEMRTALAMNFSRDVLDAAAGSDQIDTIVVMSAEIGVMRFAWSCGAVVIEDRPMLTEDPLNVAVAMGASWAAAHRSSSPVVVIPADLPAMSSDVLSGALERTRQMFRAHPMAFVPDQDGTGTTLLAAAHPADLRSGYGETSAERHRRLGAAAVENADVRARHDVDTMSDLVKVRQLGVGQHTDAACHRLLETATVQGRSVWNGIGRSAGGHDSTSSFSRMS